MTKKLTEEQAIIITGVTGIICIKFSKFHADVEKRLNRPVFIHEFANTVFALEIKKMYLPDFKSISAEGEM
jgi:hypothetical protein